MAIDAIEATRARRSGWSRCNGSTAAEKSLATTKGDDEPIRRILAIELWLLGDVVLATPMLRALRDHFPEAEITALGKPHAEELLRDGGLADKVITFDFPWTASSGKYLPDRYDRRQISELALRLSGCEI